jgi:pilus assembly protein Flp/PilA
VTIVNRVSKIFLKLLLSSTIDSSMGRKPARKAPPDPVILAVTSQRDPPMLRLVNRFGREESGATMVEYALLVVLIGLIAATGANVLGNGLNVLFSKIGSVVSNATVPSI